MMNPAKLADALINPPRQLVHSSQVILNRSIDALIKL
jgi:hypothetical protein